MPTSATDRDALTGRVPFERYTAQRTREAAAARIARLSTIVDVRDQFRTVAIGNAWTRTHYDGEFGLTAPDGHHIALSLVFVQSKDGNSASPDPGSFGGGATDKHLIYEGLSRVAADAVLAGAGSVHTSSFFSVWHPQMVALRASLGLPRHPAQIVISKRGEVDINARVFNVPDMRVFLIGSAECFKRHAGALRARPWVRHVQTNNERLRDALDRIRVDEGIQRMSAIGGRHAATSLVDEGLAQDIYLTTTSQAGGDPRTPWYVGKNYPRLTVVTKKQWFDGGAHTTFEHMLID